MRFNMRSETKDNILMGIIGIALFLNILFIILFPPIIEQLVLVGFIILGIGLIFLLLSLLPLHKKGTSNIITTGIYAVVRHPMYLGAILMFVSHIFLGQNWAVAISTIVAIVCCYLIVLSGDQRNIEKFGDEYKRYMTNVPRTNFILGIIRLLRRRNKEEPQ